MANLYGSAGAPDGSAPVPEFENVVQSLERTVLSALSSVRGIRNALIGPYPEDTPPASKEPNGSIHDRLLGVLLGVELLERILGNISGYTGRASDRG